jgi:flagellar biosynthesis protein FlhB
MEGLLILLGLYFLHWVGDFVFQSSKISETKSTVFKSLIIHVSLYVLAFLPILFIIGWFKSIMFLGLLFTMHLITDYWTSQVTNHYRKNKKVKAFFTTIGFDQFLHNFQILLLYYIFIL